MYFHNCGTEYYEPWEGENVMQILEHNGFEVIVPKQDCCGLPLQSSGLFDDARKVVLRLARNLAPHVRDDENAARSSSSRIRLTAAKAGKRRRGRLYARIASGSASITPNASAEAHSNTCRAR